MNPPRAKPQSADIDNTGSQPRAGVRSVEVAARLMEVLAKAPAAMNLKDLAACADMSMSKAHRYLVSLGRAGLVDQDTVTGRYDLGRLALAMGLTALGRMDTVRLAMEALPTLRDNVQETAVLAIWTENGPTVIRFEESAHPVRMNIRPGSILPLLRSSIGQVFAAHIPKSEIAQIIATERGALGGSVPSSETFERLLDDVRARGLNRNVGDYVRGVSAMSVPVFDAHGQIVAVIGVLGHEPTLDTSWDGPIASTLLQAGDEISQRLGHRVNKR
ncbi:MAG: Glycerol operon regulatory protein [Alphaproteobacteria bacterium MarineAlpha11_Bin1]|nr:MAG: Glycerol operon regulatory protein [Alphaproteobacteria bacterium MarineAlpha11_Bin1]|tara:strand:- start:8917 stop:9738 length:822 start_codon:yes stop_codon:yes gene_type:complete